MKKLIISVVALLAGLTCFAGCAKEDFLTPVTSSTESSSSNSETSSTPSSEESNVESSVESSVESNVESSVESSEESSVESSDESSSESSSIVEEDPLADAAEYLEDIYRASNKETRSDYEVVSSVFGYEITWSVDVEDIEIEQGSGNTKTVIKVSGLSEDVTYVLTATISDGEGNTKTVEFTRVALAALNKTPQPISQKPEENTPYKLYVYQATKPQDCYFTGEMSSFYFATTDVYEGTPDLYVEYIEGTDNFNVYFNHATKGKLYIGVVAGWNNTNNHEAYNVVMDTNAPSSFFWSAEHNTILTTIPTRSDANYENQSAPLDSEKTLYLGNYKTYVTIQASEIKYYGGAGNNVGGLVEMVSPDSLPADKKIADVKEALSVQSEHKVNKTINLTTVDERYPDVEIAWSLSDSANASILDGELTLTIPEEEATVTLTATLTCGGVTDTKVFTLTLGPAIATPTTEEEIVNAAYSLATNETLPGTYTLTGIITKVNTAYDASYQNVTVTIVVDGMTDKAIECYRLKGEGADAIKVGDTITVTGTLKNYNGKVEFDQGCTLDSYVPGQGGEVIPGAATLTFDDLAKRTSQNDNIQVWEENGVKLTNNKHESRNPINGQYYNPVRLYANTNVVIEYAGMTKLVFVCNTAYQPTANLVDSIGTMEGVTVSADDTVVTVEFASAQDSFTFVLVAQVRLESLTVYSGTVTPPDSSDDSSDDSSSDDSSSDDSSDVEDSEWVASVPVVGVPYIFGMTQGNVNNTIYYLAGGMDGYYLATTTDANAAIETYIEATEGGYYFYTYVEGVKTYINMVVSADGAHVNGAYETTASTVYTIDETNMTLIANVGGANYWFATRNDNSYTTMGPCKVSYNGFFGVFYGESEGGNDSSDDSSSEDSSVDSSTDSSSEDSSSDDSSSEAPVPPVTVTAPVEGVAYTVSADNANGTLWLNGNITDGRFDGSTSAAEAVSVYVENVADGQLLYMLVNSVKTYFVFDDKSAGASTTTDAASATVFEWNADLKTLVVAEDSNNRAFGVGATSNYNNFSCYDISGSYNWGQFIAVGGVTPPDSSDDSSSEDSSSEDSSSEVPPAPTYTLILRDGSPLTGFTMYEEYQYAEGTTLELPELIAEGKTFLGWFDINDNAAPATMPAEAIALMAKWEITPYTLTIKQDGAEDKTFTFGIEYTTDIDISVNDLTYVLKDNLPTGYVYLETLPETFTLEDYTFTVTNVMLDESGVRKEMTKYDGNVTDLGFAEGTLVYALENTGSQWGDTWNKRAIISAPATQSYVAIEFVSLTDIPVENLFFVWGVKGAPELGYIPSANSCGIISKNGVELNGDIKANVHYILYIACELEEIQLGIVTGNSTVYFANVTYGNGEIPVLPLLKSSSDGSALSVYDGDVTALGFAAGSTVQYKETQDLVEGSEWWHTKDDQFVGSAPNLHRQQHNPRIYAKADYVVVSIEFALSKAIASGNVFHVWAYDADTKNIGTLAITVGTAWAETGFAGCICNLDGTFATSLEANTVYVLRLRLEGTDRFNVANIANAGMTTYYAANSIAYATEFVPHVHSYEAVVTPPTCTEPGYTTYTCECEDTYTEPGDAATGVHVDEDANYKCDVCTKLVEPADGETLTIAQAIALAKALGTGKYSTNSYTLIVEVVSVYNTTYGNMNVTDDNGDAYVLYGTYLGSYDPNNKTANRYDSLTYKPVTGDILTVCGKVGSYSSGSISYQIQNAVITNIEVHTCQYTEATCKAPATCTLCQVAQEDSTTVEHVYEEGACKWCGKEEGSTYNVYAYDFTAKVFSANGTQSLGGVNWTIAGDGGYWGYDSQNGKGQQLGSGNSPYKSLTVTSESFSNVSNITINTSGASSIIGSCKVYVGDTLVETITLTKTATNYSFDVSGLSGEIKLEYTQTSSKAIYIKSISVTYAE